MMLMDVCLNNVMNGCCTVNFNSFIKLHNCKIKKQTVFFNSDICRKQKPTYEDGFYNCLEHFLLVFFLNVFTLVSTSQKWYTTYDSEPRTYILYMLYDNYVSIITRNILNTIQLRDRIEPRLVIYCYSLFNLSSDIDAPTRFPL